jgi:hypothetical protein
MNGASNKGMKAFPKARFVVVFNIAEHELDKREEIRRVIVSQRSGRPYDGVYFQDELPDALKGLEDWGIPKEPGPETPALALLS